MRPIYSALFQHLISQEIRSDGISVIDHFLRRSRKDDAALARLLFHGNSTPRISERYCALFDVVCVVKNEICLCVL